MLHMIFKIVPIFKEKTTGGKQTTVIQPFVLRIIEELLFSAVLSEN